MDNKEIFKQIEVMDDVMYLIDDVHNAKAILECTLSDEWDNIEYPSSITSSQLRSTLAVNLLLFNTVNKLREIINNNREYLTNIKNQNSINA